MKSGDPGVGQSGVHRPAAFGVAGNQRQADFLSDPAEHFGHGVLDRPGAGIGEQRLVERKQPLVDLTFAYGCYLTVSYFLYGHDISGWTTIVVGLMLFSGLQLVSLGIVGEYIGRIFEEVKARPLFVVKRERGQGMQARQP